MSEWISVKDRLPDTCGKYLVWTENTGVETCRWDGKWRGGRWTSFITHWIPLPTPPKEETI